MWFSMPTGCGGITVERQAFVPEFKDDAGTSFFRAPDHFAPRILALTGFALVERPEGAPDDLPQADPLRDSAIAELTASVTARDFEIRNLREDLGAATARIAALLNERTDLTARVKASEALVAGLQEQLEDKADATPVGKQK